MSDTRTPLQSFLNALQKQMERLRTDSTLGMGRWVTEVLTLVGHLRDGNTAIDGELTRINADVAAIGKKVDVAHKTIVDAAVGDMSKQVDGAMALLASQAGDLVGVVRLLGIAQAQVATLTKEMAAMAAMRAEVADLHNKQDGLRRLFVNSKDELRNEMLAMAKQKGAVTDSTAHPKTDLERVIAEFDTPGARTTGPSRSQAIVGQGD